MKRSLKYRNVKTVYQGIRFDSKKEAERYKELRFMEISGVISDLRRQPSFVLQETFRDRSGRVVRAIKVTWDFAYTEDGRQIVEDVKSAATRKLSDYSIRRRLFKKRYPEIGFKEI